MAIRKVIEINEELCDGCGLCVPSCAEGALAIIDGKARVTKESYCDGLGACLGECPQGALKVMEREAPDFDEAAVHESATGLRQWPVQLKLVPAFAPYLRNADLLIAADCVPFTYAGFHRDFLDGRALLVGCPKLDDLEFYVEKLQTIFETAQVRSVSVVKMEVPCCTGIAHAARAALDAAGLAIPMRLATIGVNGFLKEEQTIHPGGIRMSQGGTTGCGGGCPSQS